MTVTLATARPRQNTPDPALEDSRRVIRNGAQKMLFAHGMRMLVRRCPARAFAHLRVAVLSLALAGCGDGTGGYTAAATFSANGFLRNGNLSGGEARIWGYVDHRNLYGDGSAKEILEDWWSGDGPGPTTWRFTLKARQHDEPGHSFPVHVPNDPGRDALLRAFVRDARDRAPTRVFLKGRIRTFEAPTNLARHIGIQMELQSSRDVLFEPRPAD